MMKFASVYMALSKGNTLCNAPNNEQKDNKEGKSAKAKAAADIKHTAGNDDSGSVADKDEKSTTSKIDSSNQDDSFDSYPSDDSIEESQNVFAMNTRRPY